MNVVKSILTKTNFSKDDIIRLLKANEDEKQIIFKKAFNIKEKYCKNKVYLRALIEVSNICKKDCFYCGIRKSNPKTVRYEIPIQKIKDLIGFAYANNYSSVVLQSGENAGKGFCKKITEALMYTKQINRQTGITLSCGEQTTDTYQQWFDAGAERYLLRIETSNRELYHKIHPVDTKHCFERRIEALKTIKKIGYQTGTGVMIGLPFQTVEDLAADLLFMQNLDIDMCGMGPYIEHNDTPLYRYHEMLEPVQQRAGQTLLMIALLRIMMKDINIAATTALHTIDKKNITQAIYCGANIIMPNITPLKYRENYFLYKNKHSVNSVDYHLENLKNELNNIDHIIDYQSLGNSIHYLRKLK